MKSRVLIVAGSDSGGGAGIQGDLKTVTALGGYAATAITALTAQNTEGVFGIHEVPPAFIAQQIALVLDDIGADAIKTGMLHSAEVIEVVAGVLCSPLGGERASGKRAVGGNPKIIGQAQELRRNSTNAERKLWQHLSQKQTGFKFRKQHPVGGKYIADFVCLEATLVIELDGEHHNDTYDYDQARDRFLAEEGYRVLRFRNKDVFQNIEGVVETIQAALDTPHDSLREPTPPQGGSENTIPLILDPVMVAKGGAPLLQDDAVDALKTKLLPMATLVTPNIPEAELLANMKIQNVDDMRVAAKTILSFGVRAVLVKGGHLEGDTIHDLLVDANGEHLFSSTRIDSRHTHGTGCTLASAIATGIAQGMPLKKAVERARAYVREAIKTAPGLGKGHGPLNHGVRLTPEFSG